MIRTLTVALLALSFSLSAHSSFFKRKGLSNKELKLQLDQVKQIPEIPRAWKRSYGRTGADWPRLRWKSEKSLYKRLNRKGYRALDNYLFNENDPTDLTGMRTDGVIIIHGGRKIYERYARGHKRNSKHLMWSISKTFTNGLAGAAVAEGKLKVTDSVCKFYEVPTPENCDSTLHDFLHWSSGLYWLEGYEGGSPRTSSVLAMLYGIGQKAMAPFVLDHKLVATPGMARRYSTGDTNVISGMVQKAYNNQDVYDDLPWKKIFNKIGIRNVTWEQDPSGTFIGGSNLYITPSDLTRYGYLFLNQGKWRGRQVLPKAWVHYSTLPDLTAGKTIGGAQWWPNRIVQEDGSIKLDSPDIPADAFMGLGHWSQVLLIIPSHDIVAVRTGDTRDESKFSRNEFGKLVIDYVEGAVERSHRGFFK